MMGSFRPAVALLACVAMVGIACSNPEAKKRGYMESGDKYVAAGKYNEAIVQYRNAVRTDAKFGEARLKLGEAYEKVRNIQQARRELIRAADLLPERADVQIKAGAYLLLSREFEDAKDRAGRALAIDPNSVDAMILKANALAGLKDIPGAVRDIEEGLAAHPGDGRMYTSLGTFMQIDGKKAEAEAAFVKAAELSPTSAEVRLALANFYWVNGRAADAERVLLEARAIDPKGEFVNRMLAALYLTTGRAPLAEEPLKAAVAASTDPMAAFGLADYYIQTARPDEAVKLLKPLAEGKGTAAPAPAPAAMARLRSVIPLLAEPEQMTRNAAASAATLRLAEVTRSQGQKDEARKLLDGLMVKEPKNPAALTLLSEWQRTDGDIPGAIKSAKAATEAAPTAALAHFALAQAQASDKQITEAAQSLTEVLRLNPRITAAQLMLSRIQLGSGDVEGAVRTANDAKMTAPGNPDVQLALARSLLAKGDIKLAEAEVQALVARYPQAAATQTISGALLLAKGNREGARAAFTKALEIDANAVDALEGLLAIDLAGKNVAAAVARLEARTTQDPNSAPLMFLAARTYAAAQQLDKSEAALRSVIRLDPSHLNAYVMLGRLLAGQKRIDEAITQFDAAAARQPSQVGPATMSAILLQMQNKDAEARKRYESIVAGSKSAPVAANNLAWLYAEQGGNLDVALQLAQSAKAQLPDVAEINDTLGWIYVKKNLPQLAIPVLEQSVRSDPKVVGYQLHLGMALAKAGQGDKAKAALERALQLNPSPADPDAARQALADLKADVR